MIVFPGSLCRTLLAVLSLGAAALTSLRAQNDPASRREAIEAIYPVMIGALEAKNFGRARNICEQAILWEPQNPVHHYNLACIEAQAGGARLPYAMGALELAIALGFDDAVHLQADPDLEPLHADPKFRELVRKVIYQAAAGDAQSAITLPPERAEKPRDDVPAAAPAAVDAPAPAGFHHGVPVGLYFMTRYWLATRTLEKAAWYFAPDGTVYRNLEAGFSAPALAAHPGPKGKAATNGNLLEVTWADGQKASSDVERDGTGFIWDMGIFTAVKPFGDASEVAGVYEGGESLVKGGNTAIVSKRLELRPDGTFSWTGVSFLGADSQTTRLTAGASGTSEGHWELNGFALSLTDKKGAVVRRIAFPYDDEKSIIKPDRMFFGGLMYRRQP